jgi:hypothetical protein
MDETNGKIARKCQNLPTIAESEFLAISNFVSFGNSGGAGNFPRPW